MKKSFIIVVLLFIASFLVSCISLGSSAALGTPKSYKPVASNETVIGTVQVTFEAQQGYSGPFNTIEKNEAAYTALLQAAQSQYQGNIDVRDITWRQGNHISGVRTAVFAIYEYHATGRVVTVNTAAIAVESSLERAVKELSEGFTARSRIAIIYITTHDRSTTDYVTGELEHLLRRQGFFIVDRSELDKIRSEQQFGASGEVNDNTAARIGQMAGASVVITGRVDGEGNLRRLRLRALDTTTAQVVGTASERL